MSELLLDEKVALEKVSTIEQALQKENVTEKVIRDLQQYKSLTIKGIDDKDGYEAANKARIACKNVRVLAEKVCKAGREDAIKIQKEWIAKEKEVTGKISEVEDYLKAEQSRIDTEKENIRLAAERAAAERIQARVKGLIDNGCTFDGVNYSIGELTINETQLRVMDDSIFSVFLEKVKSEHERDLQMKAQAERERLAEVARIEQAKRDEEARIKKEREELERQQAEFKAEQEKVRKEAEAKQLAIAQENERIAREQREKEAELNRQAEAIRKEKEAAELAEKRRLQEIENERIAKENEALRIEAERLAAIEAENRRKAEAEQLAIAEQAEKDRQAALAPDKEKLMKLASDISEFTLPEMTTDGGKAILDEVVVLLQKVNAHITKKVKTL